MRRRRFDELNWWSKYSPLPQIGIGVTIFGAIIWIIVSLVNQANTDKFQKLQEIYTYKIQLALGRIDDASKTIEKRKIDFPSKYSDGLQSQLQVAESRLQGASSNPDGWLTQLAQSINNRDWNKAQAIVDQLDTISKQDIALIDRILGPPGLELQGLFDVLDQKSKAIDDGLIQAVETEIRDVKTYIDTLPKVILCGSKKTLSFSNSNAQLISAQLSIANAKNVLNSPTDGPIDKPLAYDTTQTARTAKNDAKTAGDQEVRDANRAPDLISSAKAQIETSTKYVDTHRYRYTDALLTLTSAKNEVDQAQLACEAADFKGVENHTKSAIEYANSAIRTATEPTATPKPRPTIAPSSHSSSSNPSTSPSYGSSDSGSTTKPRTDSGSVTKPRTDSGSTTKPRTDSGSTSKPSGGKNK